jgi:hypothetical protein
MNQSCLIQYHLICLMKVCYIHRFLMLAYEPLY